MADQSELRRSFHDQLAEVAQRIDAVGRLVLDGLDRVTPALLEDDRAAAEAVADADAEVDAAYAALEHDLLDLLARQSPLGRDLRFLVACFRIVQELERCGDLVASIARRVGRIDAALLDPQLRAYLYELGAETPAILRCALDAFVTLDADAAEPVERWDDVIDDLHRRLLLALFERSGADAASVVELGLVARFYERIADHAVVVAERVRFVASGEMDPADRDES